MWGSCSIYTHIQGQSMCLQCFAQCVILNYIVCLVCTAVCIVLWCGVFSWAEHEVQHWQCVLSTASPLDLVVMWLLMSHNRWMLGGPCLFVVCLCLPRVVDMLWVHAWPSVTLECVQVWVTSNYAHFCHWDRIYIWLCVGCFFIAAIMFADFHSHSHSPSDWTQYT